MQDPEDVLSFWLGPLDDDGRADDAHRARWFAKDQAFDDEVRRRFGRTNEAALRGDLDFWAATPRGRLALVIVLDQLTRNIHRGAPRMFEGDARALACAREGVERREDRALPFAGRVFLYMPFMHSEGLADQERCVALFRALADESSGPRRAEIDENLKYAIAHRDIVARFGRFPHRNAILGRASTAEEEAFLGTPMSSF